MTSFKHPYCCLCGSLSELTGEHKVKASALRQQFGESSMSIGHCQSSLKIAQGVKSKALHFESRICKICNTHKTQKADLEFDRLNNLIMAHGINDKLLDTITYTIGSDSYLNVLRYFAKLLCCHLAEMGSPRFDRLAKFAMGEDNVNCVSLLIDKDYLYQERHEQIGPHPYASHGGLVIYADSKTGIPNAFHSTPYNRRSPIHFWL